MSDRIEYMNGTNAEVITFDVQCNGPNSYIMRFFDADDSVAHCRPVWKQEWLMWQRLIQQKGDIERLQQSLKLAESALKLAKEDTAN